MRLVEENATLIGETNNLRRTLKTEITQKRKMESLLGLSTKYMLAKHAQKKLNDAVTTTQEIHEQYKQRIEALACLYF